MDETRAASVRTYFPTLPSQVVIVQPIVVGGRAPMSTSEAVSKITIGERLVQ